MSLFEMKMNDADIKNLSYGFYEWLDGNDLAGDEYEKHNQPSLFNDYAEYLMNEEGMEKVEMLKNMYAVVQYYGDEDYLFQNWYEEFRDVEIPPPCEMCQKPECDGKIGNYWLCSAEEEEKENVCSLGHKDGEFGCSLCAEEEEDNGFGTAYHDGSGYADCDSGNTGYRTCKELEDKSKWCSECVYLNPE